MLDVLFYNQLNYNTIPQDQLDVENYMGTLGSNLEKKIGWFIYPFVAIKKWTPSKIENNRLLLN